MIPQYIRSNFSIRMTLRSIQNQSFKDIEIIIVDDGSCEEKINEIFKYMKNDNRIILLKHKERKSTLLTRVDGIRYSSGEYIIQVDQDDMFINNLLFEKLYNKMKEINVDMIQYSYYSNDNPKVLKLEYSPMPRNIIIKQPELKTAIFAKSGENKLLYCKTRMIWDHFVKRETFIQAINDLGDEYMNHIFRLYEDILIILMAIDIVHLLEIINLKMRH